MLVAVLAVALAELVWLLVPPPDTGDTPTHTSTRRSVQAYPDTPAHKHRERQLSPAVLSLFGQPGNAAPVLAYRDEDLKETELDLTLKGILAGRARHRKLALIAEGGEKEKVYRIGNQIAGAEITHIASRRVILERKGVTESLTLETTKPRRGRSFTNMKATEGITLIGDNERLVSRSLFDRQMQRLPEILSQAQTAPYWDNNGHKAGFRVVDIEADSVFEKLGLRQEDIIVTINGVSVRNNKEALAAYQSFRSADALQVGLLRDGQAMSVDFSIR